MNIEEKFRQETGKSLYADTSKEIGFSSEYVNWLEQQLRLYGVVGRSEQLESGTTCMMCRQPKEKDGHTCCEDCAGVAF